MGELIKLTEDQIVKKSSRIFRFSISNRSSIKAAKIEI